MNNLKETDRKDLIMKKNKIAYIFEVTKKIAKRNLLERYKKVQLSRYSNGLKEEVIMANHVHLK